MENKHPQKRMAAYGFIPTPLKPGMWRNETRPIQFNLVLDDFGVEYEQKKDAHYLLETLNTHYEAVAEYLEGKLVCAVNM